MIRTEFYIVRSDGVTLNRTYSDTNLMIERDGVKYSAAIDPAELNRQYIETEEFIPEDKSEIEAKARAYDIITGRAEK